MRDEARDLALDDPAAEHGHGLVAGVYQGVTRVALKGVLVVHQRARPGDEQYRLAARELGDLRRVDEVAPLDLHVLRGGRRLPAGLVKGHLVDRLLADHLRDLPVGLVGFAPEKKRRIAAVDDRLGVLVVAGLKLRHALQDDRDADVAASHDGDGLLDVRYRADIGKFVENEVDGNGQLAVVVDGGAVAQEVDRLPHHDRVQEGEGLVGVGHAGDQRRLRAVRVAHLVKLHLIVLQDLADLAQAYPRQTGVAGDEDGLEGLTGGNAEVVVVAEGDVLIRGEAPAIRRAHVVATALELAGDLDVGRAPAADRHRVAAEGRARRARPTLALLELLARLDLQEQQVEGALEALIALAGLRQR